MTAEDPGCAPSDSCPCKKTEENQTVTDDNRLIRRQKSKFRQLSAMSRQPYLTPSERAKISNMAAKNGHLLARMENDRKIAEALEKILAVYEGRIRKDYDPLLSQAISSIDFVIQFAKAGT